MSDNKSPKGLYPDEIAEFYKMYDSGKYYLKEIAEWFGISQSVATRYIKRRDEYDTIRVKTTQRKGK
jgi:transposase